MQKYSGLRIYDVPSLAQTHPQSARWSAINVHELLAKLQKIVDSPEIDSRSSVWVEIDRGASRLMTKVCIAGVRMEKSYSGECDIIFEQHPNQHK